MCARRHAEGRSKPDFPFILVEAVTHVSYVGKFIKTLDSTELSWKVSEVKSE